MRSPGAVPPGSRTGTTSRPAGGGRLGQERGLGGLAAAVEALEGDEHGLDATEGRRAIAPGLKARATCVVLKLHP